MKNLGRINFTQSEKWFFFFNLALVAVAAYLLQYVQWEIKIKILRKKPTWNESKEEEQNGSTVERRAFYLNYIVIPIEYTCIYIYIFFLFIFINNTTQTACVPIRFLSFSLLGRFSFVPRSDFNLLLCFWKEMLSFCVPRSSLPCLTHTLSRPRIIILFSGISHYFRPLCKLFNERTCPAVQMTVKTLR